MREPKQQHMRRILWWMKCVILPSFILLWMIWESVATQLRYTHLNPKQEPQLFISQCEDDLRRILLQAVNRATNQIWLKIYACTDGAMIRSLQRRANEGLHVSVLHDVSSAQAGFDTLVYPVEKRAIKAKGLMHQKILLIDDAEVWIGSTNWTTESLCVHENILIGFFCPELVDTLRHGKLHRYFTVQNQRLELWMLPETGPEALAYLTQLLNSASHTVRVALFALSHPQLIDALIETHRRGVDVEVILDSQMASCVSKKALAALIAGGVPVRLYKGVGVLHYKLAWIDDILISGSTNWTQAAFKKNADCILILHELNARQTKKLSLFWHALKATSKKQTCREDVAKLPLELKPIVQVSSTS